MPRPEFQPGFRISIVDGIVLLAGAVAVAALWQTAPLIAFIVGCVVAHFFLFCNVFCVARTFELIWSALFVSLCSSTILFEQPHWTVSVGLSLVATIVVIGITLRKPSYHGIGWQRINPHLREWWENQSP